MHALKTRRPAFARQGRTVATKARQGMSWAVVLQVTSIGILGGLCGFVGGLLIEEICLNLL
ncbi:MAG: hypothetical protein AAF704_07895 [Cyanobacteria bacterium P01_D01_bin.123]